jgi:hypothetical protein
MVMLAMLICMQLLNERLVTIGLFHLVPASSKSSLWPDSSLWRPAKP